MPRVRNLSRSVFTTLFVVLLAAPASAQLLVGTAQTLLGTTQTLTAKLDPLMLQRTSLLTGRSPVIVTAIDGVSPSALVPVVQSVGGTVGRTLLIVNAIVADLPNSALILVATNPIVARVSLDRGLAGTMERTGATVRATDIRRELGYDGSGVGVAIIDSGVSSWHDDLSDAGVGQRVDHFVDFVNGRSGSYDDYGHGSHVAGIVAGNGRDSNGARTGIAPGARLTALKVLDQSGRGRISNVIAALDFVLTNRHALNLRVVNLSVSAGVYESYHSDPLTRAAKRVVDAGVVVVAAAGNAGRNPDGRDAYGGIGAPGNAPWVLTVGASSHMGTIDRADDRMAAFSSRGPTRVDQTAKPDLVAPGVGIESLSDPDSTFYRTKSAYLLAGTAATTYLPYLSLSGTSMAAPVVSGTVALMLQANPALTPNQVKAILQYTSQVYREYDPLTEGAGFLNAYGAVTLARYFVNPTRAVHPVSTQWSRRLIWGNQLVRGGRLTADANAWRAGTTWGEATARAGEPVAWGVIERDGSWQRWGATCADAGCRSITWAEGDARNVVWGPACGGGDCQRPWTVDAANDDDASVVWGTDDSDESVVWGTDDDASVVWGTDCRDRSCEPVVWATP